jgi:hypothetical protein
MHPAYELLRPVPNRHPLRRSRTRRLRVLLHLHWRRLRTGDPRTTSTVTLALLILGVVLNFAAMPRPVTSDPAAINRLAEAGPRNTAVRILDGRPRSDACEDQTWPYIDQRCLRTSAASRTEPAAEGQASNAQANATQHSASNAQSKSEPDKLASVAPSSATSGTTAPQSTILHDVPLPQPRPQIEDDEAQVDDEDLRYPSPYYSRRYGPDGRPLMYPPPRYMDPREARAWQRYEYREYRQPRRTRHELHIGGFRFRF